MMQKQNQAGQSLFASQPFVLTVLCLLAAAPCVAAKPVNLFYFGDSITYQGMQVAPLNNLLTSAGYTPSTVAVEGHIGYLMDGTNVGVQVPGLNGLWENLDTFMNHPGVNSPDTYILLMIGTNDVEKSFLLGTGQVQYRMNRLITGIHSRAPLSHIIVSTIIPNLRAGKDAAVQKFNTDIAPVLTGPNVTSVDMYAPFQPDPTLYMYPSPDLMHPTQAGHDLIAQTWFNGINAIAGAAPVPEPASIALLSLGAVSLFRRPRRQPIAQVPAAS